MRDLLEDQLNRLYHYAFRMTGDYHVAEDITQETMLRAWRHRRRLEDPRAARVWLFTIASNLWRDQLRRQKHRVGKATRLPEDLPRADRSVEEAMLESEEVHEVVHRVDELPTRQRQVLWLHAFEELSLEEISRVLDISVNTAKVNLFQARKTLRRRLNGLL